MQKETEEKLRYFIKQETWYTRHPSDLERFYQFVAEAYKNNDMEISFDEFFGIIEKIQNNSKNFRDDAKKYYLKYKIVIEAKTFGC